MTKDSRFDAIVALVERRGFVSVGELSRHFRVSEVTIRRNLQQLHDAGRLLRTYGGAAPAAPAPLPGAPPTGVDGGAVSIDRFLMEEIDVLVAIALSPRSDLLLLERAGRHDVAIVAESLAMEGARTLVAVDNYRAGWALGVWAGEYAAAHFGGRAEVLDLTYHLSNTMERSRGFAGGLRHVLPAATIDLSLTTQSDRPSAYQLTNDALQVHPTINVIFCINDITACGALQACKERGIDPAAMLVLTFGLEGDTLKDELLRRGHLKAGLAMFPEVVGPACIEAAVAAFNGVRMPAQLVTPHAVLTPDTLPHVYRRNEGHWELNPAQALVDLAVPRVQEAPAGRLPRKIGFLVPFREHEWYKNLVTAMQEHAARLGSQLVIAGAAENLKDEIVLRKLAIAHEASKLVNAGDVIMIDGGQVTTFLAEALAGRQELTVITNAVAVFEALRREAGIDLLLTGGLYRQDSQTLIGPTAEAVLRDLRADKLFLAVAGVSLEFGLSHTNLAEISVKQAMIRAAREVILLADHTKFEQESVMQIAPITAVDKLVTDNALPASTRLELAKLGIEIVPARI
jgi:DeoR/GlpR family transcriptional regulator of sugar metabolism